MTASTALGFDQSDPGEEYDPYPDTGDSILDLGVHWWRCALKDLEIYESELYLDEQIIAAAERLCSSYSFVMERQADLISMLWTPSRYMTDYTQEWTNHDFDNNATCVILRLAVRQAIEMQMAEDVSEEVEDELEDYGPTRASCAFGRDVRRATVRKMELWMLDDCKEADRMRRGGCWKRSDRSNKRQWERGVIRAQRLAMRPREVVIEHLKWSKWRDFGMVATVTDVTHTDDKVRLARDNSVFQGGYDRPWPLDWELQQMDDQQELAIDEMEAELNAPDLGPDLLDDWCLEDYEDVYHESLRRVLDRGGSMTTDTWWWHLDELHRIDRENGPEYDYEAEGPMSGLDDDYDDGLDDSWDDACGFDCQCYDCRAIMHEQVWREQVWREHDPADDVMDEEDDCSAEDWGLEARLMSGMGRPRRHSKIQRGPQWAKHKPGFSPRRADRW